MSMTERRDFHAWRKGKDFFTATTNESPLAMMKSPHQEVCDSPLGQMRGFVDYRMAIFRRQAMNVRNRKQYRYYALWTAARNETKFHRIYEFGKVLPAIRARLKRISALKELCQQKVIAMVISLMERTYIRVGNEDYEKPYGSYGITTLKNKHVEINGSRNSFLLLQGRKITHDITLKNRRLANVIKQCLELPGKELFQYYDDQGERHGIDSGMINDYIKDASGGEFTAKDFRTWAGTLNMMRSFKSIGDAIDTWNTKKNVFRRWMK